MSWAIFRVVLFSLKTELLLRKSGPGLAAWRTISPYPHEVRGVHCFRGGVLPWCRTRFDGTDIGAP